MFVDGKQLRTDGKKRTMDSRNSVGETFDEEEEKGMIVGVDDVEQGLRKMRPAKFGREELGECSCAISLGERR